MSHTEGDIPALARRASIRINTVDEIALIIENICTK